MALLLDSNNFRSIYLLPLFMKVNEAPSSPVQNRRLLSARNARMSSIEMPDENEKSVSSASTSPCHSPKSRLLAANLFVVLYNFKPRHADELELKAGYKLTVLDATDKDWWRGNCLGAIGVFPSTYVTKLGPREKPLQVIQSVNINSIHGDGIVKLLRDQIVIQVYNDGYLDGTLLIRTAEHRQGHCPLQYLQEV